MNGKIEEVDFEAPDMGQYSPEVSHDMILASIERENEENPNARIQLVEMDELPNYLGSPQQGRTQFVIYQGNHYMAADVLVENEKKTCILLDAANDPRYLAAEGHFKAAGYETNTASGFSFTESPNSNLQNDAYSCPLFAFDHSVQFAQAPDTIHGLVSSQSDPEYNGFYWDVLPPNFLWNIQSIKTKDEYVAHYPVQANTRIANSISFNEYINLGLVSEQGKERNNAVNVHVLETVKSTYSLKQKKQTLEAMDKELDALEKNSGGNIEQIVEPYATREAFHKSIHDLNKGENSPKAQETPQKTGMFRSLMKTMRGQLKPIKSSAPKKESESVMPPRTPGKF